MKKRRCDAGVAKPARPPQPKTIGAACKAQQESIRGMIGQELESGRRNVFGCKLNLFRQRPDKSQDRQSAIAKKVFTKYNQWRDVRVRQAATAQPQKFAESAHEKRARVQKTSALASFRQQMRRDLRHAINRDIAVRVAETCTKLRSEDVPLPFRACQLALNADVIVLASVSTGNISKELSSPLNPNVMTASLLGLRLCTPT